MSPDQTDMPPMTAIVDVAGRLLRPELPQLSGTLLKPLNTLHSRGIYAKVQLTSGVSHWRFQYARKKARRWIKFKADDKQLWLALETGHWGRKINERDWWEFDQEHQALSFILAHEEFLDHLQELTGISWQVEDINQHVSFSPETNMSLKFTVEYREQLTTGVIDLCQTSLSTLVGRPLWERAELPPQAFISPMPIPLSLEFRVLPMSLAELDSFRQGDILIGGPKAELENDLVLVHTLSRRPLWQVCQDKNGFRLAHQYQGYEPGLEPLTSISDLGDRQSYSSIEDSSHMSQDSSNMSPTTPNLSPARPNMPQNNATPDAAFNIDQLPVELRIQVAQLTLTVDELNQLEPGHTLTLPVQGQAGDVSLIANGRPIGRGELVMVGDQLGIRITQLG